MIICNFLSVSKTIVRAAFLSTVFLTGGLTIQAQHAWKLIWSDEFNDNGLPDSTKWNYNTGAGGWGNKELEFYTSHRAENARVENGTLIIEARKEKWNNSNYSSARLVTKGKGDWKYGRVEVR